MIASRRRERPVRQQQVSWSQDFEPTKARTAGNRASTTNISLFHTRSYILIAEAEARRFNKRHTSSDRHHPATCHRQAGADKLSKRHRSIATPQAKPAVRRRAHQVGRKWRRSSTRRTGLTQIPHPASSTDHQGKLNIERHAASGGKPPSDKFQMALTASR